MNRRLLLAASAGLIIATPAWAQDDPVARLDAPQRAAVQKLLDRESRPGEGSAQANQVELADVDGDGRPEMILLWTFLGPTYWRSQVTVFQPQGAAWRERASTPAWGMVERMTVQGREIRIATLMLGPSDPRCCPTRKAVQRVRWAGGKLVSNKP